jgi:hypothetical protein
MPEPSKKALLVDIVCMYVSSTNTTLIIPGPGLNMNTVEPIRKSYTTRTINSTLQIHIEF